MKKALHWVGIILFLGMGCGTLPKSPLEPSETCVVLLHGLNGSTRSTKNAQRMLVRAGYHVVNEGYKSRSATIERLSGTIIPDRLTKCRATGAQQVHFIAHSMGGMLVRYYLKKEGVPDLGRVVMVGTPNQGTELVDRLSFIPLFKLFGGRAAKQLGTSPESLPNQLGKVDYEVGIIAGTHTLNPVYSLLIPGPDDGQVAVERTKVEGMADFLKVPYDHSLMMRNKDVIQQMIYFLEQGRFRKEGEMIGSEMTGR